MNAAPVKYYLNWLQQENYKSFYLAFLRVAISLWLLKEVFINWPSMNILYGQSLFAQTKNSLQGLLPNSPYPYINDHYRWFMSAYILFIVLNIFGIGRWFTALLVFLMLYVLQRMSIPFANGGDMIARLVLFYLIFADSYNHFVLVKQNNVDPDQKKLQNLFSNLAAFSVMLQLCLSYFASGTAKIMEPLWRHGEAVYYALSMERFMGTPFNNWLAQHRWLDIISNYGVLIFELLFPVLIWIKKTRVPLLATGVFFHLCIYIFLMIYGFQVIFVLMYGFFLPDQKLLDLAKQVKSFFKLKNDPSGDGKK